MKFAIYPPEELIEDAVVTLPISKSISTRVLVLDALTGDGGTSDYANIAVCDDTEVIKRALTMYRSVPRGDMFTADMGSSGAALRFLTAFFASQGGCDVILTGSERLCQRPMRPLIDALKACGAQIECLEADGFAPLHIKGCELEGGDISIDATVSSQFVSALLMVAPYMKRGLTIHFEGEPVSLPYIKMTLGMMGQRGIEGELQPVQVVVPAGRYQSFTQPSEGDWSAAAFWYEISALSAGWITITNLSENTLQGDKAVARFFECLGVLTVASEEREGAIELTPSPEVYGRLDLDLTDNPDLAPALAVTCCLIGVPFKFTGLGNLGVKESDRLEVLCQEMDKIGRRVEKVRDYGLEWDGKGHPVGSMPVLDAHGDHRMAMAFAPVSLYVPGIIVDGVESISKSYPSYWEQLREIGFKFGKVE